MLVAVLVRVRARLARRRALAQSIGLLVAGRAIQGAAGAVFPLAFGIIRDEFPRERVATGIGLISATFGIGGGAGPRAQRRDRRPPLLRVDLLARADRRRDRHRRRRTCSCRSRRSSRPAQDRLDRRRRCSRPALGSLLLAVSEGNGWGWGSARVLGLFAAAAVLLVVWVRFEQRVAGAARRHADDARARRLDDQPDRASCSASACSGRSSSSRSSCRRPRQPGYGFGAVGHGRGLFLLPSAAVMLVAGPLAGSLAGRVGLEAAAAVGHRVRRRRASRCSRSRTTQPWEISSRRRCSASASASRSPRWRT